MKQLFLWLGASVMILLVIGGTVLYVQRPSYVVERAADKLGRVTSARYTAVLQLENAQATQQVLGEQGAVALTIDGVFARAEDQPDSLQADVQFVTKTESVTVNVDGEMRFINDRIYALIETAPPMLAALAQLKGQWLAMPRGSEVVAAAQTPPEQLFTDVRRTGTARIGGEEVVVYHAEAKDEAVVSMMDSIAELLGTRLTTQQIDNLRASVDRVERVPVAIKIRRFSTELRELSATLVVPGGNTMHFTLTIHETNQLVSIAAPDGAVPLEQLVQPPQVPQP